METGTINTNPAWWAWKLCKDTVNVFCGSQPSKWQQAVTIDTRTGAKADLTTSGKFGLVFGYTIDSGSVDAAAEFNATALLSTKNRAPAIISASIPPSC
ncbi:MAG: hypothetical protein LJE59_14830 [Chromatiaceae bacterium]|nr:hypothetical protein [Chromatiaceae bacterium]